MSFNLVFLEEMTQSISCNISLFLTIIDFEVVTREFLGLANVTRTRIFYIYKLIKFTIISKNKNLVFAAFQVIELSLKSLNNGSDFSIVYFIPCFCMDYLLKEKNNWVSIIARLLTTPRLLLSCFLSAVTWLLYKIMIYTWIDWKIILYFQKTNCYWPRKFIVINLAGW